MNLINNSRKLLVAVFLMVNLSNTYAEKQNGDAQVQEAAAEAMEAVGAEATVASEAEAACRADDACDVASAVSESMYGGIEQEYVVKGCKVTIYNDGPVKMVNVKTNKPCNAPIPKDHKFSKETRTYQENGCTIIESKSADGITDAVMDCSKRDKTK